MGNIIVHSGPTTVIPAERSESWNPYTREPTILEQCMIHNKNFFLLIITALTMLLFACDSQTSSNTHIINSIDSNTYKGHWVLINYWATWCKPCYEEIPQLNKFYLKHKKQGIIVLGINFDGISQKQLQQFARKQKINYSLVVRDPQKQFHLDDIATLPMTFIISPEGKVTKYLLGPQTVTSLEENLGLRQPL